MARCPECDTLIEGTSCVCGFSFPERRPLHRHVLTPWIVAVAGGLCCSWLVLLLGPEPHSETFAKYYLLPAWFGPVLLLSICKFWRGGCLMGFLYAACFYVGLNFMASETISPHRLTKNDLPFSLNGLTPNLPVDQLNEHLMGATEPLREARVFWVDGMAIEVVDNSLVGVRTREGRKPPEGLSALVASSQDLQAALEDFFKKPVSEQRALYARTPQHRVLVQLGDEGKVRGIFGDQVKRGRTTFLSLGQPYTRDMWNEVPHGHFDDYRPEYWEGDNPGQTSVPRIDLDASYAIHIFAGPDTVAKGFYCCFSGLIPAYEAYHRAGHDFPTAPSD